MSKSKRQPIYKFPSTCCALCLISAKNYHTLEELEDFVKYQKKEAFSQDFYGEDNTRGQRSIMCIVSPGEDELEDNLRQLNFELLTDKMERRLGYPGGNLKMYLLSF